MGKYKLKNTKIHRAKHGMERKEELKGLLGANKRKPVIYEI